jgi:hypothetical protein
MHIFFIICAQGSRDTSIMQINLQTPAYPCLNDKMGVSTKLPARSPKNPVKSRFIHVIVRIDARFRCSIISNEKKFSLTPKLHD